LQSFLCKVFPFLCILFPKLSTFMKSFLWTFGKVFSAVHTNFAKSEKSKLCTKFSINLNIINPISSKSSPNQFQINSKLFLIISKIFLHFLKNFPKKFQLLNEIKSNLNNIFMATSSTTMAKTIHQWIWRPKMFNEDYSTGLSFEFNLKKYYFIIYLFRVNSALDFRFLLTKFKVAASIKMRSLFCIKIY